VREGAIVKARARWRWTPAGEVTVACGHRACGGGGGGFGGGGSGAGGGENFIN
jgi:hypothetical protein